MLTALMTQVVVPVPGSPVPITGQALAVLVLAASQALAAGLHPFLLGGLVKTVIAAVALPGAWRAVRRADAGN